jgi:hypothetical protein
VPSDEAPRESRAPFPRWANSATRAGIWGALAFVIGGPCFLIGWARSPLETKQQERVDQPVSFDHRHHVRDDGIACRYCHYDVERSPRAGLPETELCMGCHAQVWTTSPMLEPVRRSFFAQKPIRWRQVNLLPDFVYFNHAIHVAKGVGCESCHGRIDLMANVYQAESLQMNFCLDCHRHPEEKLRPPEFVTAMGYVPPEPQEVLGARLVRELSVHPPVNCSGCHR